MPAFNVVRFRVKPGLEEDFLEAFRSVDPEELTGATRLAVIRTGDNSFCSIGEWESLDHLAEARPMMIGVLDTIRHLLEDMGSELGVTDPVSGEAVVMVGAPAAARPAKPRARKKAAARKAVKKPAKRAAKAAKKAPAAKPAKRKAARKPARKTVRKFR